MFKLTNSFAGAVRASTGKFGKSTMIIAAAVACLAAAPLARAGDRGHDRDDDHGGRYFDPRTAVILGRAPGIGIDIRVNSHDRDRDRFPEPARRPAPGPVYEERTERVWVEPTYRTVSDRVWVGPEYRTVSDRVWREPVV